HFVAELARTEHGRAITRRPLLGPTCQGGPLSVVREFVSSEAPGAPRTGPGGYPCQGVYHRPEGQYPKTALIAAHYEADFSEHYLAEFMAELGYGFLGWTTRFRGRGAFFLLEHALVDIGVGVQWLRDHGVEKVVLLGNSGGASLMSAYQ